MDIKVIQTNERTEVNISAISADDSKTIDFILKVIEGCRPIASPDLRPQHYPSACNTEGTRVAAPLGPTFDRLYFDSRPVFPHQCPNNESACTLLKNVDVSRPQEQSENQKPSSCTQPVEVQGQNQRAQGCSGSPEGSALVDEHLRKRARTHLLRHKPL